MISFNFQAFLRALSLSVLFKKVFPWILLNESNKN